MIVYSDLVSFRRHSYSQNIELDDFPSFSTYVSRKHMAMKSTRTSSGVWWEGSEYQCQGTLRCLGSSTTLSICLPMMSFCLFSYINNPCNIVILLSFYGTWSSAILGVYQVFVDSGSRQTRKGKKLWYPIMCPFPRLQKVWDVVTET